MDLLHIALRGRQPFLADVFDSKQSNGSLTMPQSCFPEAELITFAFYSGEAGKLLIKLDRYDGVGADGIFLSFFVRTANYLAQKISIVLHKLVRIGGFSMCCKVGNITPFPKSGSANFCPDYQKGQVKFGRHCKWFPIGHLSGEASNHSFGDILKPKSTQG